MRKSNIRSFRFSDEVLKILEGFNGDSLNDKFNNLVLFCFREIPKRELTLERINKEIANKNNASWELSKKLRDIDNLIKELETIKRYGEIASRHAAEIVGVELKNEWDPDQIDIDYLTSDEDEIAL